jgi:hypothetical protein
MVAMSDDLGTQSGLLLSPALIEEFFVPEYRRLFALYKAEGVLVSFHSCGHIEPALDLFMELGVDILNPVQTTANNLDAVRTSTAGRMALQGGINSGLIVNLCAVLLSLPALLPMMMLDPDGERFPMWFRHGSVLVNSVVWAVVILLATAGMKRLWSKKQHNGTANQASEATR